MIDLEGLEGFDNLEDINKELQRRMMAHNQRGIDDFDGLSPEQMHALQTDFSKEKSPLVMNKLSDADLALCPLLGQVQFVIDKMKGGKHIQLTKTGSLPTKLVKEIYELGYLKNYRVARGTSKLYKESDSEEISITRILLELSSLTKKVKGTLSLTKKGEKHAEDGNLILEEILMILFYKFNWAYFDRYDSEDIGRLNSAYSLFLLKKYGNLERSSDFYAEKYFRAFPQLLENKKYSFHCYSLRTFELYFNFMGFVQVERKGILGPPYLKKTIFLDRLITLS